MKVQFPDSVPPSQLWELLTPEERASFLKTIENPSSASLQALLRSEVLEKEIQQPWWETPKDTPAVPAEVLENESALLQDLQKKPDLISLPDQLLRRQPGPDTGPPLLYNICAVLYVFYFKVSFNVY